MFLLEALSDVLTHVLQMKQMKTKLNIYTVRKQQRTRGCLFVTNVTTLSPSFTVYAARPLLRLSYSQNKPKKASPYRHFAA